MNKRLLIGIIIIVFTVAGGLAIATFKGRSESKNPFPAELRKKARFKLYFPTNMHSDLRVVPNSFVMGESDMAILFNIDNTKNGDIYNASVQQYPAGFDFAKFKKKFKDTTETLSPVGSVMIGDYGTLLIGSLLTRDNTWVLVQTKNTDASAELTNLISSFRPVD